MKTLTATLALRRGGLRLNAPQPGLWRDPPAVGALVRPGSSLGALEILGALYPLVAPPDAFGVVTERAPGGQVARRAVDCGALLVVLDPEGVAREADTAPAAAETDDSGPVFRTPLGGRFYARPTPDDEPFVKAGDPLTGGETVALIEVMKTFNRVRYAGAPTRVREVRAQDGEDLEAGDVLLVLE